MPYIADLFGEPVTPATKKIKLRSIETRYRMEVVRENAPDWVTTRFTSPKQIFEMFKGLQVETKEHFITLHLDGKNRVVCLDRVSVGSLNQSIVHPREVFKSACMSGAAAILLIHNHPTGDPAPSKEDIAITNRLKECGDLLNIHVLDHIIIGETYLSMVEQGIL